MKLNINEMTGVGVTGSSGVHLHAGEAVITEAIPDYAESRFMAECRTRTKDNKKCDLCELRFKCYTQREAEVLSSEYTVLSSGAYFNLPP